MKRIKLAALVFGLVLSQSAFASVIYSWKTTAYSPTITSLEGTIEITDAAAQSGLQTSFRMPLECSYMGCTGVTSPILSFHFAVNGQAIDLLSSEAGLRFVRDSAFDASFLVAGDRLNLNMFFSNTESDIRIGDSVSFNTDRPGPCETSGVCLGATGEFVQVPEPGSMLLMGLGLMFAAYRGTKYVAAAKARVNKVA